MNMHIAIVGMGFVGKAVAKTLETDCILYKIDINTEITIETLPKVDAVFICLPTPTINGKCDYSLVVEAVEKLKDNNATIIIKSTLPISAVQTLLQINPELVFCPEFLREKFAEKDAINPSIIVIGGYSKRRRQILRNILQDHSNVKTQRPNGSCKIREVNPEEAMAFKYLVNTFLATKVVFLHQFQQWLQDTKINASWETIITLIEDEGRLGKTHLNAPGTHGYGFGGSCFPKDTEALYADSDEMLTLLGQVIEQNKILQAG